jgi:hypothetical protein
VRRYRSVTADNLRWDGFEFREGDIVISTPPKCGTTWMQMICALLIFQDPSLPQPLSRLSPWLDMQTETVARVFAVLAAQAHRRFIKTHTPFDGLAVDDRVSYVCVARDPRDVAVSWYNHLDNVNIDVLIAAREKAVGVDDLAELPDGPPVIPDDPRARFWQWVEADEPLEASVSSLKSTLHHVETFWDRRDRANVILVHYSDLQADLDREMRRLAAALRIEVPAERWSRLVAAARFDEMRQRAGELAPEHDIAGFWSSNDRFFNRGAEGQWRALLAPDELGAYERRVRELAPPDLARWVHTGWASSRDEDPPQAQRRQR